MAKTNITHGATPDSNDALREQIEKLSAQVNLLTANAVEEEEEGPQNSKTTNAQAQVLVSQVGDVVQAPGFVTPIPERVTDKGPKAVAKFLKAWRAGQTVSARQIGDESVMADSAVM
tara:strand:+ start:167 stop:517 length:351 start_codon:yes stop_codon:yes gene_type:complete